MAFDRYQRAKDAIELDLIPVMNLLVILIPFLLMGASFFHIGVIPASLPSHVSADPPPEPPAEITLNLVVKEGSLEFTASSTELDEATLTGLAATFPFTGNSTNTAPIVAYLKGLKERFPTSDTMIVLPIPELSFDNLVTILDATREFDTGRTDNAGEPIMSNLFNVVIFSQFVTEDAFATAAEEGGE
ncbi:MAG: biopolymer transporter ExbD [Myxococcota bacterium]